jgi:hypothetical protein
LAATAATAATAGGARTMRSGHICVVRCGCSKGSWTANPETLRVCGYAAVFVLVGVALVGGLGHRWRRKAEGQ